MGLLRRSAARTGRRRTKRERKRKSGRKITVWISVFSIRWSADADDSFSGRRGGRAGPQRRHRAIAAPERIARARFHHRERRERGGRTRDHAEDHDRFIARRSFR